MPFLLLSSPTYAISRHEITSSESKCMSTAPPAVSNEIHRAVNLTDEGHSRSTPWHFAFLPSLKHLRRTRISRQGPQLHRET